MTAEPLERTPPPAGTGSADLPAVVVGTADPRAQPLFDDLAAEYGRRYGGTPDQVRDELERYPAHEFEAPHGVLVLVMEDGVAVAGGAYRRYDARTAELKRIWTAPGHRRRGLGHRVLDELEGRAAAAGYARIFLTTGPRQPEAKALYLRSGYRALFDVTVDPETIGPLPFEKDLVGGADPGAVAP